VGLFVMLPQEFSTRIQEYSRQWFRAEEAIKAFERLEAKVLMASVQELRYAGRRFAQILDVCHKKSGVFSPADLQELEIHLIEAIQNCIKARHDALDAAVHFIHKRITTLISAVGIFEVRAHFPNFNLLEDEIKAIDRKIIEARADRSKLDGNYDAILLEHRDKLIRFYKELESSEFAIRKSLLAQKSINRRNLFVSSGLGFILGIIASVIASNIDRVIVSSIEKSSKPAASASETGKK
jgi:hypothetical protein